MTKVEGKVLANPVQCIILKGLLQRIRLKAARAAYAHDEKYARLGLTHHGMNWTITVLRVQVRLGLEGGNTSPAAIVYFGFEDLMKIANAQAARK